MNCHASSPTFAFAVTFFLGFSSMSASLPGSCFNTDQGKCILVEDSPLQSCSCEIMCYQSLAGLQEIDFCCEDFQEK